MLLETVRVHRAYEVFLGTWEEFSEDDEDWDAFFQAYETWLWQRKVVIPHVHKAELQQLDAPLKESFFEAVTKQPSYMGGPKGLQLMEFQLLGVSWLYFKWWLREGGILSDEMGLGKLATPPPATRQ